MRYKYFFYVLFATLFVVSCGKNKQSYISDEFSAVAEIKSYPYNGEPRLIDPVKYFDSVKYIVLETGDDFMVSNVNELFFVDSLIVVVDAKGGAVFFFNNEGKYSHKIQRRGRGPGEYLNIHRVMVDEPEQTIMIYDIGSRKLLYYDFSGKYIKTISNFCGDAVVRDIINLPSGGFICYRQDGGGEKSDVAYSSGVWKVDAEGNFEKYIYHNREKYPFILSVNWFNLYRLPDGKIGLADQNFDDIFFIENDTIYRRVEFKLPGKKTVDYAGIEKTDERFNTMLNSQEKGGYIFTDWGSPDMRGYCSVFSRSDNTIEAGISMSAIMGDDFIMFATGVRNNSTDIYTAHFYPNNAARFLSPEYTDQFRLPVQKILEGLTPEQIESGNPILQLLYVKHFTE